MKNLIDCRKKLKSCLFILAGVLCLCGCSDTEHETETEESNVPVIQIGISGKGGISEDWDKINELLGEMTEEKIGVRAQLVWTGRSTQTLSYLKSKQNEIDILSISYKSMLTSKEKNLLLNMEPYLEYAPTLQGVLEEKVPLPEEEQDGVYGIPKALSDIQSHGVIFNREYVEKYDLDVSSVHTPEDLEPLLSVIKEKEPDVIPWVIEGYSRAVINRAPVCDMLDDCLSCILYEENDFEVCNFYETQAYEEQVQLAWEWQQKGYLAKDILTEMESGKLQVVTGEAFATECVIKPDETQYDESIYGDQVIIQPFDAKQVLDTEDDWLHVWSILSETSYPKEAVQVLNLLYEDEDVINLLLYGIEGEHYIVNEDGSFDWPEGVDQENVRYRNDSQWKYNIPAGGYWKGMSEDLATDVEKWREETKVSCAYGFWFDESQVSVDMAKLESIVSTYATKLETGLYDPEIYLPRFREELKAAGADLLVQEVQRQLDEWKISEKEHIMTEN